MQKYTKTTSRTIAWIKGADNQETLLLAAPYQRNPVWSEKQQSSLIETILLEYPIPELYMQDIVDSFGMEKHIVVDGQQRIRAVLEFINGDYDIQEPGSQWYGMAFDDLKNEDKMRIFEYDFVVRQLPQMPDEQIRSIFQRINRNNVSLNSQELRHATYWGAFIKLMEEISDLEFWETTGLFSANERRRMLDTEYVSELVVAYLNGLQNKKVKLEDYFRLYETEFPDEQKVRSTVFSITGELGIVLPGINRTRWKKKSDFYTLFLCLADNVDVIPLSFAGRRELRHSLLSFAASVDIAISKATDDNVSSSVRPINLVDDGPEVIPDGRHEFNRAIALYAKNVERAASDLASRRSRQEALSLVLMPIFNLERVASSEFNNISEADNVDLA